MKRIIFPLLAGLVSAHANIISWNVDVWSTINDPAEAGAVPAPNWNSSYHPPTGNNNALGPSITWSDLKDNTGAVTPADVTSTKFTDWFNYISVNGDLGAQTDANNYLLNAYNNRGGDSAVTVSSIPYASYSLYVYFGSDTDGRAGTVTVGATTYDFSTISKASIHSGGTADLIQTTSTTGANPGANYAVFTGLTGDTQSIAVNVPNWGGIVGFQIVADLGDTPVFGLHPANQSAALNSEVTFTASATADPTPQYQWEYSADGISGWTELIDKTNAALVFDFVQFSDAGYYRVVATNVNGSVTSNVASLEVFYGEPEFFEQPSGAYAEEGSTVQLTADAWTYGNPGYQWYKDGSPLEGEVDNILVLTNVDTGDDGDYFLRVTDDIEPDLFADSNIATVVTFPAWNGLVSHDPFDTSAGYTLGELPLQDPSVAGYDSPWTDIDFGDAEPEVQSGSLSYPDPLYLGSSGDRIAKAASGSANDTTNSGRTFRELAPALVVTDNTTGVRYLSFLYQNGNENAADNPTAYSTLALYNANTADANRNFEAGVADDALGANLFFRINNAEVGDLGVPLDSDVHLFVVKFDLSDQSASDNITVWIDPQLGSGEPAGGVSVSNRDVIFDRLAFSDYASNSMAWDELRWGSTFDSVTLNPNPADDYATWIAGYPGVGGLSGFTEDADADGIANGLECFFGTDPSVSNSGLTQIAKSGSTVTFQHPQNATLVSNVTVGYRWSTDLVTFHNDGATAGGATVSFAPALDTPAAGTTTVTAMITGTEPPKLFVVLESTKTP